MSSFFTTEVSNPAFSWKGLRYLTVKSNALKRRCDVTVYDPGSLHQDLPMVILLHGVYGSHWAWALSGGVHETMPQLIKSGQVRPMLLVMPSDGLWGDGSSYSAHQNEDYEQWIVTEVPLLIREQFPQVTPNSPLFITGLSMGGYGALKLGAKYFDLFSGFSGLSSITKFEEHSLFVEDFSSLAHQVGNQENILEVLVNHNTHLKPFRFDCGEQDPLLFSNRHLHQQLLTENIPHEYAEFPGNHNWAYWQEHIADHLIFFEQILRNQASEA